MAGMKTVFVVLLGLCCVVHGFVVEQPQYANSAWQFSVDGTTADHKHGGHLVNNNGFQYRFDHYDAGVVGNGKQVSENTFTDLPEQFSSSEYNHNQIDANTFPDAQASQFSSERSGFGNEGYVYNARSQDNAASYDYNNRFSTQSGEPASTSHVLGVPEERDSSSQGVEARPDYVYDARAAGGAGGASFSTLDSREPAKGGRTVPATGHQGPASIYTPSSETNGAFVFYDARSDDEKKSTSAVDEDPASDSTVASTAPVEGTARAPHGTHGCPNSYWARHVAQWPAQLKITTHVSQAFGGVHLRKNLEIVYGTTTVFQALLDTREDPFSKLLRHGVAALLNAYTKPAFTLKPTQVSKLFHAALASKTAAAAQAQKFENMNHAFGDSECK